MRSIKVAATLLSFTLLVQLNAQDPHFSQFYNNPLFLNPALSGLMRGDLRVHANSRSQWGSVAAPFSTISLAADMAILRSAMHSNIMGIGLLILDDRAGTAEIRNTQVQLSAAFSKSLNGMGNHFLSFGGQLGIARQRLNLQKLLFDTQYDGQSLNPDLQSGENIALANKTYFDFTAGLNWSYRPDRYTSFYAGLSVAHLNQPSISFLGDAREALQRRHTLYAGASFRLNHFASLLPKGMMLRQGPYREYLFGALLRMNMGNRSSQDDPTSIYFGSLHRLGDAQILILRFDYGPVGLSFSYDINISGLQNATNGQGGAEIALMYQTSFTKSSRAGRPVECPAF